MFGGNTLCSLTESSSSNDEFQPRPASVPNLTAGRQFACSTIRNTTLVRSTAPLSLHQHPLWENLHKSGRDSHNWTLGAQKCYGLKDRFFSLPVEETKNYILAIPGKFRNIQGVCCYMYISPEVYSINHSDLDRWYRLNMN